MRQNSEITLVPAMGITCLTVLFGANAVAIKLVLTGMGPLTAAGLRFALAAVAIAIWARWTGRPFALAPGQLRQVLIISVAFSLQLGLFYLGLQRTYASRGVLISNLLPFFVLFLSHRFIPDERITGKKVIGIVLGFAGVAVMFVSGSHPLMALHRGDSIVLAAVLIWSCNVVYTKRIIKDFAPFQLVLYPMIISVPLFLTAGAVWDPRMVFGIDKVVLGAYLYQGLVTAAFGFVAWSSLLKRYGATTLHSFVFIMPIAGVITSGLVLGEPITPAIVAAMALIAGGIGVIHLRPRWPTLSFPLGRGL